MNDPSRFQAFPKGRTTGPSPMKFVRICDEGLVKPGQYRCFQIAGSSFLLCNINGRLHAVINRCTHLKVPLDGGRMMGKTFACPVHGARFDIPTGQALSGAAVARLTTYQVKTVDGAVLVELPHNDTASN